MTNFLFNASDKLTLIIRHQLDVILKFRHTGCQRAEQLKFLVTRSIYDSLLFVEYISVTLPRTVSPLRVNSEDIRGIYRGRSWPPILP